MSSYSVKLMTYPWMWLFMKNPYEGAQCAIHLATDPKLKNVSGKYFNDCEIAESSELGKDMTMAKKLYSQTVEVLKIVTKLDIDKDVLELKQEVSASTEAEADREARTTAAASSSAPRYSAKKKKHSKR